MWIMNKYQIESITNSACVFVKYVHLDMCVRMCVHVCASVHVVCCLPRLDYFITCSLSLSSGFSPRSSCLALQNAQPVYL